MDLVQQFIAAARTRSLTVVLPEGNDERVVLAARRLKDQSIAQPIILGKSEEIA